MGKENYGDKMIKYVFLVEVLILVFIYFLARKRANYYININSKFKNENVMCFIFLGVAEKVLNKNRDNKYIKNLIETSYAINNYDVAMEKLIFFISGLMSIMLVFAILLPLLLFSQKSLDLLFLSVILIIYIMYFKYKKFIEVKTEILENFSKDLESLCKQLSILLSTGMGVDESFNIVKGTKNTSKMIERLIYMIEEEKRRGGSISDAISIFAKYFRSKHINKLIVIVVATKEKGVNKPSEKLLTLANEIQLERRFELKRKSEKISSKLLMPLMLSLMGIMVMLLVPAFMQFSF